MELRDYQSKLINDTRNEFHDHNRIISVLGCGGGKTLCFAYMSQQHILKHPNGNVWFLVHRRELIDQTIRTFDNNGIDHTHVFIGMVQTVTRHLDEYDAPTLIVFDECHHATAKMWTNIVNHYPNVPVIGLTATPARMDGKSLGDIFDALVCGPSTKWLIANNYLAPYRYYAPVLNIEDANWQLCGSDYDQNSVAKTLDHSAIYGDIMKCVDLTRKTIIYAPNIDYSIKLSTYINSCFNACVCEHFDGNTPSDERNAIIQRFRSGETRILTNVELISEGFDVPDCDCCILLRPTMSTTLYIQQAMRCMRYVSGKTAIIYDLVGNCYRHGLPDDEREWSLTKPTRTRNPSSERDIIVRECKSCHRIYAGNKRICPYCGYEQPLNKREIEEKRKAEIEEIKQLERKKERVEVGRARTLTELIHIGIARGYRNPRYWAEQVIRSRKNK